MKPLSTSPYLHLPADMSACAACVAEIQDPSSRRYRYPFVNCEACGPRYSVMTAAPFERSQTTMGLYTMCGTCQAEFDDPHDRHHGAPLIACRMCGPRLLLLDGQGQRMVGEFLAATVALLRDGCVVAVKSLGGYQLTVDAASQASVLRLRKRLGGTRRPLTVMVRDLAEAQSLAELSATEAQLLQSDERPAVLVKVRPGAPLAAALAPGYARLGMMLPNMALHHMLLREVGRPLAVASQGPGDEPMAFVDADAVRRLSGVADYFLTHSRPVEVRLEDSLAAVFRGEPLWLRRARGRVPLPVAVPVTADAPVLGLGGDLHGAVCVLVGDQAYVSEPLGDVAQEDAFARFRQAAGRFVRLLGVRPERVAHADTDSLLSTLWRFEDAVRRKAVNHAHAHLASCLAENGHAGPAIGVVLDGDKCGRAAVVVTGDLKAYRVVAPASEEVASLREACVQARSESGLATVALSGARFGDVVLLGTVVDALEEAGFQVLWHRQVSSGAAGLALGQAVVAAATASD